MRVVLVHRRTCFDFCLKPFFATALAFEPLVSYWNMRGEYRCMVVDIKRRQPIELLVNRDQPTVEMLLAQFDL